VALRCWVLHDGVRLSVWRRTVVVSGWVVFGWGSRGGVRGSYGCLSVVAGSEVVHVCSTWLAVLNGSLLNGNPTLLSGRRGARALHRAWWLADVAHVSHSKRGSRCRSLLSGLILCNGCEAGKPAVLYTAAGRAGSNDNDEGSGRPGKSGCLVVTLAERSLAAGSCAVSTRAVL
jgi:hypothetical protein